MEDALRQSILDLLRELATPDRPVYLVGGAVRDLLMGRPAHDLDFVLPGQTRGLAQEVSCRLNGALYVLDAERETTRVVLGAGTKGREPVLLDFASLRANDLEGDLRARDFTINALAIDVTQPNHLIDPTQGAVDIREKRIRACAPESFTRDPVRVLRAVRQALNFDFQIDPQTVKQMRAAAPRLSAPSAERIRDELFRMLDGARVSLAIRILDQVGALEWVLPDLASLKGVTQPAPHTRDVWAHTLLTLQYLEQLLAALVGKYHESQVSDLTVGSAVLWLGRYRDLLEEHFERRLVAERSLRSLLFFAALYHDIAKPETRVETQEGRVRFLDHPAQGAKVAARRARGLALSAAEVSRVENMVEQHMRVHFLSKALPGVDREDGPSRKAIYRYYKDTGDAGIDLVLLALADLRGTYDLTLPQDAWQAELETGRALLEAYWEKHQQVVAPARFLSGDDLMQIFGLAPGRRVGRLLAAIREAQAAGEIQDQEEALAFARRWVDQHPAEVKDIRD